MFLMGLCLRGKSAHDDTFLSLNTVHTFMQCHVSEHHQPADQ